MRNQIIGISAGRSGTKSLVKILNQNGIQFTHEHPKGVVNWHGYSGLKFNNIFPANIKHVEKYLKKGHKVIYLKRGKMTCKRSWLEWLAKWDYNHFQSKKPKCQYDICYPTYSNKLTLDDAVENYLKEYEKISKKLIKKYPQHVHTLTTMDLNDKDKINDLLEFING